MITGGRKPYWIWRRRWQVRSTYSCRGRYVMKRADLARALRLKCENNKCQQGGRARSVEEIGKI